VKISCILSPPVPDLKGYVAVVIDALRSTSTLSIMFGGGIKRVLLYNDYEEAKEQKLYNPKLIVAGEEQVVNAPEFYTSKSISEYLQKKIDGKDVVFSTSNGTSTMISATHKADIVLAASMLNLTSTADTLAEIILKNSLNLAVICSGINGSVAMDDLYVAGALIHKTIVSGRLRDFETDDGVTLAKMVYGGFARPMDAFVASESGKRLSDMSMTSDVALCAKTDLMPGVLFVENEEDQYSVRLKKEDNE